LEFEIAQTKKSKELKAIKAKIAAIMAPAKLRAEKLANRRGYTEEINKAGKVIYKSEGKFPVNGETAMYKVTKSEVTATSAQVSESTWSRHQRDGHPIGCPLRCGLASFKL
jgi:hypothetical protein